MDGEHLAVTGDLAGWPIVGHLWYDLKPGHCSDEDGFALGGAMELWLSVRSLKQEGSPVGRERDRAQKRS